MSLHSPLGRVLGLGSAKEGTGHWWAQRVTAVAAALLGLWFLISILLLENFEYVVVSAWAGAPQNSILLALTTLTFAYHSKLGVQVVIEDYVHGSAIKMFSLLLNTFAHVLLAAAGVFAILKIALGAA